MRKGFDTWTLTAEILWNGRNLLSILRNLCIIDTKISSNFGFGYFHQCEKYMKVYLQVNLSYLNEGINIGSWTILYFVLFITNHNFCAEFESSKMLSVDFHIGFSCL